MYGRVYVRDYIRIVPDTGNKKTQVLMQNIKTCVWFSVAERLTYSIVALRPRSIRPSACGRRVSKSPFFTAYLPA